MKDLECLIWHCIWRVVFGVPVCIFTIAYLSLFHQIDGWVCAASGTSKFHLSTSPPQKVPVLVARQLKNSENKVRSLIDAPRFFLPFRDFILVS
jgi:hypothetical protein